MLGAVQRGGQFAGAQGAHRAQLQDQRPQHLAAWLGAGGGQPGPDVDRYGLQPLATILAWLVTIRARLVTIRRRTGDHRALGVGAILAGRRRGGEQRPRHVVGAAAAALHRKQFQVAQPSQVHRGVQRVGVVDRAVRRVVNGTQLAREDERTRLLVGDGLARQPAQPGQVVRAQTVVEQES